MRPSHSLVKYHVRFDHLSIDNSPGSTQSQRARTRPWSTSGITVRISPTRLASPEASMHTFVDPLRRAVTVAPNSLAVVCGDQRLTYAQTFSRCSRLAGALHRLGLVRGDRV